MQEMQKAIFLDRDGVINVDTGFPHRIEEFALIEGAASAIRLANQAKCKVLVVSNQGGIALGKFGHGEVKAFHDHMVSCLEEEGAYITDIEYCPHHPEALEESERHCTCRKPSPEMILRLAERHRIDTNLSALIGDRETDLQAAEAAGVDGFLFDGSVGLDILMAEVLTHLSAKMEVA